jgi:deoxyribodipyrimidine photo-lyase
MPTASPVVVWFRKDLRLDDHPALERAVERAGGGPIVPVFVWSPEEEGAWPLGGAQRWWLHHSLVWLRDRLAKAGVPLVVARGPSVSTLVELARSVGATAIVASRRYEPFVDDGARAREFARSGIDLDLVDGHLLTVPESIRTGSGGSYTVYTPFSRNARASLRSAGGFERPRPPVVMPKHDLDRLHRRSLAIDDLELLPTLDWAKAFPSMWTPGGEGAATRLKAFLAGPVATYADGRDRPAIDGTSALSPHLAFGELSIRRLWHAVGDAIKRRGDDERFVADAEKYRAELLWREFAYHVLVHHPHTDRAPLRPEYARFPWRTDRAALDAWRRGRTGYPLVDAGMRQLWTTGWMHNRVRMVVASFLVKHLLLPWQEGARWFWDTLVDADLANNSLGWQWAAGSGADAAPYFRIFNPVLQGEKFDADGTYVRRWVPELARLAQKFLHRPWDAPPAVLEAAGVRLGTTYPRPIVEHTRARERALEALSVVTKAPKSKTP